MIDRDMEYYIFEKGFFEYNKYDKSGVSSFKNDKGYVIKFDPQNKKITIGFGLITSTLPHSYNISLFEEGYNSGLRENYKALYKRGISNIDDVTGFIIDHMDDIKLDDLKEESIKKLYSIYLKAKYKQL
jgi:hypothetical protein